VRTISLLALIAALAAPAVAAQTSTATTRTAVTNPAQMPDGTYTGVVQKVLDNKSIVVKLSNGTQATLKTVKDNVDFSKCQNNEAIRFSLINGLVAVYAPDSPQS
jgi:uncharacterized protein with FMN-binding domain